MLVGWVLGIWEIELGVGFDSWLEHPSSHMKQHAMRADKRRGAARAMTARELEREEGSARAGSESQSPNVQILNRLEEVRTHGFISRTN